MGTERKSLAISQKELHLTAVHEAGHCLVALCNPVSRKLSKATVIPRASGAGGFTSFEGKDDNYATKRELLAKMDVAMGGRAAEQVVFGADEVSTGSSSDFKQATEIATKMVMNWGMSSKGSGVG